MEIKLPEKLYYNIGEISKAFNVNPSLLRFWEKEFKEIQPKKKSSGTRKYTPEMVRTLQFIHHLVKERGFTLEGAKNKMKQKSDDEIRPSEVAVRLQDIRAELVKLREMLD